MNNKLLFPSLSLILIALVFLIVFGYINHMDETPSPGTAVVQDAVEVDKEAVTHDSTPDTSHWLDLLTRTTSASYGSGHRVCAKLSQHYKKKKEGLPPDVHVHKPSSKIMFMDYRYTVLLDNASPVKDQLAALQKAGFLESETTTHEGSPAITYKLTVEGWGRLPRGSSYAGSLCYTTGQWATTRILDYELLDDQGSGLKSYQIKYEVEYVKHDWATPEVVSVFKNKSAVARQHNIVLIEGPTGYFNPSPVRNRSIYPKSPLPTIEEAQSIVNKSNKFIQNLCMMDRIEINRRNKAQSADMICEDKEAKKTGEAIRVYSPEIPSRGNIVSFKFSYINYEGVERYGNGSFIKDKEGEWLADSSFSLVSL
jgi:hypothetical protein